MNDKTLKDEKLYNKRSVCLSLSEIADDDDEQKARIFAEKCIVEAQRQNFISFSEFIRG